MPTTITPQAFVNKWRDATLKERAAAQEHFIDLCRLVGHPTPAEDDPTGQHFAFEAGVNKVGGGGGFADVWKRGCFAWEYKGKHGNLDKAYQQLLQYHESLDQPPLLVVSDIDNIIVHTKFVGTAKRTVTITLEDLPKPEAQRALRAIFYEPEYFRSQQTTEHVTATAAAKFAELAEYLRKQGDDPERIAHFLIRLLFCLFAEDIDLLPQRLFTRLVQQGRNRPERFGPMLSQLFEAMATGGSFGVDEIRHFNGGLFDDDSVLELGYAGLTILQEIASLDWGSIEPSILGTLFERSLDPGKRAQLGAHYTSREDILLLVEPVLMAPLRREWAEVQPIASALANRRDNTTDPGARTRSHNQLRMQIQRFFDKIAATRVLDPACGSGNFLYVALRQMLDLEKEVSQFASTVGLPGLFPQSSPAQLYGIELNEYAHELAQATVWIGYIQWLHENGYGVPSEPILKRLDNIKQMDAILAFEDGKPVEPEWPEADVIVGNPPFLGGSKIRRELGDSYVTSLWRLYKGRVDAGADLVSYWFERARAQIETKEILRAGLLATQNIRGDKNRGVLERILSTGSIFWAWSDRAWVLDGAAVRVSMVGFDGGTELAKYLNGQPATSITSKLAGDAIDMTTAHQLSENRNLAFAGSQRIGPFDIDADVARGMLAATGNPNGRPNSDVVKPLVNGQDIMQRQKDRWVIDFGADMPLEDAALYEQPFEHVKQHVYPVRQQNNRAAYARRWWIHGEAGHGLRSALNGLQRFIVTSRVSKHRVFVWLYPPSLPDYKLCVIGRSDDYSFGVLQSRTHLVWAAETSARHGDGAEGGRPAYNVSTTFETFPFPWPPGQEPVDDPRVQAIAQAAKELNDKREAWLNPPGLTDADLKKRTLTNLYNQRPTWIDLAHKKLDAAVAAAYGWPADLPDEEILARLLALNLERAKG